MFSDFVSQCDTSMIQQMDMAANKAVIQSSKKSANQRNYDAAQTNRFNQAHWLNARNSDANSLIATDLPTLRNRSRYEIRNNSFAKGIVDTLAFHVVGQNGPTLQILSGNEAFDDAVALRWPQWASQCDATARMSLTDMINLTVKQFCDSGEALIADQKDLSAEIPLKLLMIEPDRLATPLNLIGDTSVFEGIERAKNGKPLAYWINRSHPGSSLRFTMNEFDRVDARVMAHLFRQDRPGQDRGVPWITPSLPLFAQLRRYTQAVIGAAEKHANITAVMYTQGPELSPNADQGDASNFEEIQLPQNAMLTLPMGYEARPFDSSQPNNLYVDFVHAIINEVCRCLNMPLNIGLANSGDTNFSSARLDVQVYRQFIELIRTYLQTHFLTPLVHKWLRDARLVSGYLPLFLSGKPLDIQWMWSPIIPHIQPKEESAARDMDLKSHTTTLKDEYAKKGQDWKKKIEQIAAENKLMQELGVSAAAVSDANQGDANSKATNENGNTLKPKESA